MPIDISTEIGGANKCFQLSAVMKEGYVVNIDFNDISGSAEQLFTSILR